MFVSIVHFATKKELFSINDCDIIPAKDEIINIYTEEDEQTQTKYRVVRVVHICEHSYGDSTSLNTASIELEVVECT